jgi:hypothetical protein
MAYPIQGYSKLYLEHLDQGVLRLLYNLHGTGLIGISQRLPPVSLRSFSGSRRP